jgi:hypothetical protein
MHHLQGPVRTLRFTCVAGKNCISVLNWPRNARLQVSTALFLRIHVFCDLLLLLTLEDEGTTFLGNIYNYSSNNTAHPVSHESSDLDLPTY